jgi:hypothetical protein
MEINLQALARGKFNRPMVALEYRGIRKQNHGFLGSVGRIIESPAPHDKQSCTRNTDLS